MGDSRHEHEALVVVHGIHDAVVTDTDAVVVAACELDAPYGPRVRSERIDG